MTRSTHSSRRAARGFTVIEALIAFAVIAFGLVSVAGVQLMLSRQADVARQRSEATRLAQERMEALRGYTAIKTTPGQVSWEGLSNGNDTRTTNATYARSWALAGSSADPFRRVSINVAWNDRAGEAQAVTLNSVISQTDPTFVGTLGFPLPENTTLKRPKNRSLNIPVPAVDLGSGQSAYTISPTRSVVFSNVNGFLVKTCDFVIDNLTDINRCQDLPGYILAGYVSMGTGSFPASLGINTSGLSGITSSDCTFGQAIDQNTNQAIAGYHYYLCVLRVAQAGVSTWSGTIKLKGMATGTDYRVCRAEFPAAAGVTANQRNVQPYVSVAESIDSQNYVVTTAATCPTLNGTPTVLHQNCASTNPARALDCPA